MGLRPTVTSNVGGVDAYIDTAYDKIQNVSDNMEALLALNEAYTNLEGIYLGQFSVAPIQRGDTTALKNGDHYLNTSANTLYFYLEGNWINFKVFYTQDALNTAVGQGPFNIWVAYADDIYGAGISVNPTGKDYIGFANNRTTNQVSLTTPGDFTWSKYVGETTYVHIAYADSLNGIANFNSTSGSYIGVYTDLLVADSTEPSDYTWNLIKGIDGSNGVDVTVTDLGNGRKVITGANGSVYLDDGEIPTLIDNGDGTYTITSGIESIIVNDGLTPLKGIDYYDGNSGEYISFVFAQVAKGDPVPSITDGTGTYSGTIETYPAGANWTDNAVYSEGFTTYMSKNRYIHSIESDTWALKDPSWATPTIFLDTTPTVPQIVLKGFAFKRSATPIVVAPTGGSFADPVPTTGWSDGIPAGTLPIYVTSVIFTSDGELPQPVGNPVTWDIPKLLAENGSGFKHRFSANIGGPWSDTPTINSSYMITSVRGADGVWVDDITNVIRIKGETGTSTQTILKSFAFKRSAAVSFSETPGGGSFLSPNPVDNGVTGWSDGIPAGTDTLYVSTRIFSSDGLSPQQTAWAPSQIFSYNGESFRMLFSVDGLTLWHVEPVLGDAYMQAQTSNDKGITWVNSGVPIRIEGEAGVGGLSVASILAYKRSVGVPTKPADDSASYDFSTKVLTPPSGWFTTPYEGVGALYASATTFSVIGATGVDATQVWSTPIIFTQDGAAGTTGPKGSIHYYGSTTSGPLDDAAFAIAADIIITSAGDVKDGWDIVTISDPGNGYAETKYWDQSLTPDAWTDVAQVIDGNLIVLGTIGADKIAVNSITADRLDIAGTVTPAALGADVAGAAAAAEAASALDATAKADAAEAAAISTADAAAIAYTDLREIEANAYADGIVTVEEARAILDATTKAEAARVAAEAASDALGSATAAQTAAIEAARIGDKDAGTVGGWSIDAFALWSGAKDLSGYTSDISNIGGITFGSAGSIHANNFYIDTAGNAFFKGTMTIGATDLDATNTLNTNTTATDVGLGNVDDTSDAAIRAVGAATSGTVGGWTIDSTAIYSGTKDTVDYTTSGITFSNAGGGSIHAEKFYVNTAGEIYAKGGEIGGWKIGGPAGDRLYTGTVQLNEDYSLDGVTLVYNGSIRAKNFLIKNDGSAFFKGNLAVGGTISALGVIDTDQVVLGAITDSDSDSGAGSVSAAVLREDADSVAIVTFEFTLTSPGTGFNAGYVDVLRNGTNIFHKYLTINYDETDETYYYSVIDDSMEAGTNTYALTEDISPSWGNAKIVAMVVKK